MYQRVDLTEAASNLIATLKEKHGPLMFHQSGGCCDGSQPMCFEKGDFKIGGSDIKIGNIDDCEFFMSKDQYEYWKHTHLTIDVIPGRGSSFSLEIPLGFRFIVHSRLFTEAELQELEPIVYFD
jgi:uncharacterized protein (DUF779 family)